VLPRMMLVRHSDSLHKADGVIGGPHGRGGLTPLGHEQAGVLASVLAGRADQDRWDGSVSVYSSTRRRQVPPWRSGAPLHKIPLMTWR